MDSFQIDMELLRRIGDVRNVVQVLDDEHEAGRQGLLERLAAVRTQAGDKDPRLSRLIEIFESGVAELDPEELSATSKFATGALSVCEALEQYLISVDDPSAGTLIQQAGYTLFLSLGRNPKEWDEDGEALQNPSFDLEEATEEPAEPAGIRGSDEPQEVGDEPNGVEEQPQAGSDELQAGDEVSGAEEASGYEDSGLNDLASFIVQMDPGSKQKTVTLLSMTQEVVDRGDLPGGVEDTLSEVLQILMEVTTPKRVSKAVREKAVYRVSELIEEAILVWDELEECGEGEDCDEAEAISGGSEPADPAVADAAPEGDVADEGEEGPGEEISAEEAEAIFAAAQGLGVVATPAPTSTSPSAEGTDAAEAQAEEPPPADPPAADSPSDLDIPAEEPLPAGADPDLLADFITEGFEYLEGAEEALIALENDPADDEAVNIVFRAFHTIKGVSGFLELSRVSDLAHHAETVLSQVRDGTLRYTGSVADLSLRSADVLKELLGSVREAMDGAPVRIPSGYGPLFEVLTDPDLMDKLSSGEGELTLSPSSSGKEDEASDEAVEQKATSAQRAPTAEASVRVRTDRLDRLVDMVGELVIAHTMLAQDPVILRDNADLAKKVDHTAKILRELQDLSTGLRMVPLKPAFRKVSRVVRDLSRKSGKLVRFISDGEDTEIDRTMVDIIADPLVHMVRNSLDHGLETPEDREAAGKAAQGTVKLSAYQAGGNVVVEISDDGRGLNRDKILAKAKEQGIVDSDRGMTDNEIYDLIFHAGFSTADQITEVSGRGVGMDVVRRNVESLRGRVSISSEPGMGSTFRIHLPLTLAITDGMLIRVGSQRYIIPSVKIHMSFRPEPSAISTVAGRGEMVLLHNDLLPVVRLHHLFGIHDAIENPTEGLLVIIGEGSRRSALLVDQLVTQQQFVIKALNGIVSNTAGIAGGAILGNGDVGLILDPEELISIARGEARNAA